MKFDDRTGIRAAQNLDNFLLQTYARDKGEIMNDISTPLFLGGRHWGAIRIGYRAAGNAGHEIKGYAKMNRFIYIRHTR